jgi:hypothetical protein
LKEVLGWVDDPDIDEELLLLLLEVVVDDDETPTELVPVVPAGTVVELFKSIGIGFMTDDVLIEVFVD